MSVSHEPQPAITPRPPPVRWLGLVCALLFAPVGVLITYTPVFLQDPLNTSPFRIIVVQTALAATFGFQGAAWLYNRLNIHRLLREHTVAGWLGATISYVIAFYVFSFAVRQVELNVDPATAACDAMTDRAQWIAAGLAWFVALWYGFYCFAPAG